MPGQVARVAEAAASYQDEVNDEERVKQLEAEMEAAAEGLDFERAALLRDELFELRVRLGAGKGGA
jgi:excinuclease UvrABC helicase subunit UvrB